MYFTNCPVHNHSRNANEVVQPFRFLDLPAEIRVRIASFALSSSSTIRIRQPQYNRHLPPSPEPKFLASPRLDYPLPRTPPATPPSEDLVLLNPENLTQLERELQSRAKDGHSRLALLMACRQTYVDNWASYYRHNEFEFTANTWEAFKARIPERCVNEIRHVRFRMPYRSRQMQVWRSLAELKSLEVMTVILAPPEVASRLERASCVAGARMCVHLKHVSIEREGVGEGIAPLGEGEDAVVAKRECKEDRVIERNINKILEERRSNTALLRRRLGASFVRKATSRAGSQVRNEKRVKRIDASPTPDERAMDEYFQMVDTAADEEAEAEAEGQAQEA